MTPWNFAEKKVRTVGEFDVYEVDTEKATYKGFRFKDLGAYGRRKFENALVLTRPTTRIKILYV